MFAGIGEESKHRLTITNSVHTLFCLHVIQSNALLIFGRSTLPSILGQIVQRIPHNNSVQPGVGMGTFSLAAS